ncbi:MAG: MBL fold metallo-hydrolase, partial [Gemmatimonadota bacterium]|nr:MBL fold metallo-hydrolase [Gemmatimonadota bacterium]
ATADEHNRIRLSCNCLLLKMGRGLVLLDTGFGERFCPRERTMYGMDGTHTLHGSLAAASVAPEDITLIALTHLHFDHFCGCLVEGPTDLAPLFPNAIHAVQRDEWDDALAGHSTMRSSYRPEELHSLARQVEMRFLDGDSELAPGLTAFVTGGHTRAHQGFRLEAGGHTLVYPGELIPTRLHLRPYWNMAYDMFPYQTLTRKQQFTSEAAARGWIVAWDHDPNAPWSRIVQDGEHFVARDVEL